MLYFSWYSLYTQWKNSLTFKYHQQLVSMISNKPFQVQHNTTYSQQLSFWSML